jgi:hypothetical protein
MHYPSGCSHLTRSIMNEKKMPFINMNIKIEKRCDEESFQFDL